MLKTFILACALSLFMAGTAAASAVPAPITISVGTVEYDVSSVYGSFDELEAQLEATPWWDSFPKASSAAADFAAGGRSLYVQFAYEVSGSVVVSATLQDSAFDTFDTNRMYAVVAPVTAVPIPAAGWLFMSALIGLMGKKRLSRRSVH
jgi:hypothetical protein